MQGKAKEKPPPNASTIYRPDKFSFILFFMTYLK